LEKIRLSENFSEREPFRRASQTKVPDDMDEFLVLLLLD
jgi:hypothetical protein